MWILSNFTTGTAESALIARVEQLDGGTTEALLTSYCGAVNFLMTRYATTENISKAQSEVTSM